MYIEHDLFNWLNETHNHEEQEADLLLVPLNSEPEQKDIAGEILLVAPAEPPAERVQSAEPEQYAEREQSEEPERQELPDLSAEQVDPEPTSEPMKLWSFLNGHQEQEDPEPEQPAEPEQPEAPEQPTEQEQLEEPEEPEQSSLTDWQAKEWQEVHTGFTLSLDEPPPELWTRINSPTQPDDDDDEDEDYEQGMSLQGAAYIPKQNKKPRHGINFTQRLQKTLQTRKERAAQIRDDEDEQTPSHPYMKKAAIMCGTLLAALTLSWVCLWFLQDGVAAYMNRAQTQQQEVQPAEPEQSEPEPEPVSAEPEPVIIPITIREPEPKPELEPEPEEPPAPPIPAPAPKPVTFDGILAAANSDYNIGMYSRAIFGFHRAMEMREHDIRPYIGLAACYRAKGMYFDAKRLLDEAWVKFGLNPTIETERYYLRRE